MTKSSGVALFIALAVATAPCAAATCAAASGERRVAVLEFYTSEGCDSCPPTDRWVSRLHERGYGLDRVVVLAFHVDYWNQLGWTDPYAQKRFSERQRHVAARNGARFVYTPQLVLNGKDYRRPMLRDDFGERIASLARERPRASLALTLAVSAAAVEVGGHAVIPDAPDRRHAQVYLALYEMALATQVTAGENRGKRLAHDFVVRDLAGPYHADPDGRLTIAHRFRTEPGWNTANLGVAGYVQHQATGDTLQALALPQCGKK